MKAEASWRRSGGNGENHDKQGNEAQYKCFPSMECFLFHESFPAYFLTTILCSVRTGKMPFMPRLRKVNCPDTIIGPNLGLGGI